MCSRVFIGWRDRGFNPFVEPLGDGHPGQFDKYSAVDVVEKLSELVLSLPFCALDRDPLLPAFAFTGLGIGLVAGIEDDGPRILAAFSDMASHFFALFFLLREASKSFSAFSVSWPPGCPCTRDLVSKLSWFLAV